ncbi:hypothetical protein SAMN05216339_101425 [Nitrosomonas eutropha]|uniref:Uncharacterized protein n=1 Tax=Nitrosomonas eutropha TaxID=916 RepID=A0A1I7FD36_9PROT|nr:hypothetical protein [Nitrosomonas eutropha]SFU34120.1 hypothetical protein SAMN05216339_101425 [Nitrosomonas eutropha]
MNNRLKRWSLSAMIAVPFSLILVLSLDIYNDWPDLLYVVVMAMAGNFFFNFLADRHDKRLIARIKADQPIMWNVSMNSVEIGKVSDSQYAAMQRMASRDGRIALAQFFNLGRMALVVVEKLLFAIPFLVFWMVVALAIISPESYTDLVREFQKADPAEITSAMRSFLQTAMTMMFVVFGVMIVMGYRFGFRNHYSEAVNRMLQQHCNTPAKGDVQLRQMAIDPISNQKVASSPD